MYKAFKRKYLKSRLARLKSRPDSPCINLLFLVDHISLRGYQLCDESEFE